MLEIWVYSQNISKMGVENAPIDIQVGFGNTSTKNGVIFIVFCFQVHFEDRWDHWEILDGSCTIDGVDCFRDEHRPMNKDYFSHKFHHAGLRYLIECSLGTNRKIFLWGGGVPCGSNPDLKIVHEQFVSNLEPQGRCLADKGFTLFQNAFCPPDHPIRHCF